MSSIRDIRTDYTKGELSLDSMLDCPLEQLALWIEEATNEGVGVPRPPHWGGYVIEIADAEFWQGRASRLHDRVRYDKEGSGWKKVLLQP